MKRINLLVLFTLLSVFIFAQDDTVENLEWRTGSDLQISAHVGVTTSSLRESGSFRGDSFDSGTAFLFAGRLEYFFGKNWSMRTGLGYERRDFGGGDFDYITIPVYPAWHFGKNRRWHLGLGVAYAVALDSAPGFGSNVNTVLNIGVIIPISDLNFYIELEGFTDTNNIDFTITDENGNTLFGSGLTKNRSSINFGINF